MRLHNFPSMKISGHPAAKSAGSSFLAVRWIPRTSPRDDKRVWLALCAVILWPSCQASFNIRPELFPKRVDASEIRLKDTKDNAVEFDQLHKNGAVMFFFQTKCPCVKRYQNRITRLQNRYGKHGISFFYVSSNSNESFSDVMEEAKKRRLSLPLLRDEGGHLAKLLGAQGTPTAAIINGHGELVFLGWIDNERQENETGRIAYLENAIIDVINLRAISAPTSPMFGCAIR